MSGNTGGTLRSGIRMRLTLSHIAVILVAMGLSGSVLLSLMERYFTQAMKDSLLAQAQITARALIPGAAASAPGEEVSSSAMNTIQQRTGSLSVQTQNVAPPAAQNSLAALDLAYLSNASVQLSSQLNTRIRILNVQGIVRVDSSQEDRGVDLSSDPLVARALAGQYASRSVTSGGEATMHLAWPISVEGKLLGVVYLSQPLTDVAAVVHDLRARWLLSTLVALLLSGGVGLVLSGAISSPLRRLTQAAGAVAQGQLDQQVPVLSHDEVGRLSHAFNQMTARLRAARQAQIDLIADVSHELRSPLTAIKGLTETLRDGAVDDTAVRDRFLETVERETDRLIRLVNDLLVLSRADSEALHLRRQTLDLTELVRTTTDRMSRKAQEQGLELQVDIAAGSMLAWVDPDRIDQVLVNLVDNAIKYSRPGGIVSVGLEAGPEGTVRICVQDQGIGIPAQELGHIGERFYRVDRARSRAEGGSGLGLAIARTLVQAHGGQLQVASQEGKGTTVTVTLPSCDPA